MACEPFRATVTFKPVYAKLVSGSSAGVPPGLAWIFFLDRDIFFDGDIFSLTGFFFLMGIFFFDGDIFFLMGILFF